MNAQKCFANYMQPWSINPTFMASALSAIKGGTWKPKAAYDMPEAMQSDDAPLYQVSGRVALIGMNGPMMKGQSKFGGCSTVQTRQAIRAAVADPNIDELCMVIDSPGGTVAGTAELASDIALAGTKKKVVAQVMDECCSAAYWCASQCSKVYSNATALVGCIGTVLTLEDTSKSAEMQGVQVHVISTGEYKGAFSSGTAITDNQIEYAQALVDGLNQHFLSAVRKGRAMTLEALGKVSDGRCFVSDEALKLGLIDGVQSLEDTISQMSGRIKNKSRAKAQAIKADLAMRS